MSFCAAIVILFTACGPAGPRALLAGKRLVEQGRYEQAIVKLKQATELLGTNALAFSYLGLARHQAGQLAEAEKAYQHALALDPDLIEARYNLGCVWLDENKLEPAKSTLTAYTLRRPNALEGWLKLGTAQLRSGQSAPIVQRTGELSAAERSFNEALRLSPEQPEALTGIGLARAARNRPAEAVQYFNRALSKQPDYGPALLDLAIVTQEQLNNPRLALQHYRQYLALKPAPDNAADVRAAVRQFEQELAPPPAARPVTSNLALQPAPMGAKLVAQEPVRKPVVSRPITNAPPTAASTPVTVAAAATAKPPPVSNGPKPSLTSASPTASPSPAAANLDVARVPAEPGAAASALVQSEPAPVSMRRYAYRSPAKPLPGNRPEAEQAFAQGVQAHRAQHWQKASEAYRRALQADPSYFDAWYNLGLAATEAGNLPAALSAYESALALEPRSLEARYNFALVLKQANYAFDAARELEKLLAIYPNDSRAHLALGNLYAQQLNQPAKARPHYLKVLETNPGNPQASAIRYWLADTAR